MGTAPCPTPTNAPLSGLPPVPTGWEWELLPLDDPGRLFTITNYSTTMESLHKIEPEAQGIDFPGTNLVLNRQVSFNFLSRVQSQGSGFLDLGTGNDYNGYINYDTNTGAVGSGATFRKTNCAETQTFSFSPFPIGCARRLETGATSPVQSDREATGLWTGASSENPDGGRGTKVYIESLNRQILVNDTGGGVTRYQIDVYTGLENEPVGFGNHESKVWRLKRK